MTLENQFVPFKKRTVDQCNGGDYFFRDADCSQSGHSQKTYAMPALG